MLFKKDGSTLYVSVKGIGKLIFTTFAVMQACKFYSFLLQLQEATLVVVYNDIIKQNKKPNKKEKVESV